MAKTKTKKALEIYLDEKEKYLESKLDNMEGDETEILEQLNTIYDIRRDNKI